MKIILDGCLIALMKRFDALVTMQKTSALCKVPFLTKSTKKNAKNDYFFKNAHCWQFFLIFSEFELCKERVFFAL